MIALIGSQRPQTSPTFVTNSLRFRASASASFSRTLTTPTLNTKWTWSAWVKLGTINVNQDLLVGGSSPLGGLIYLRLASGSCSLAFYQGATGNAWDSYSSDILRDPSGWCHLMVVVDLTQATASKVKFYKNGIQMGATIVTSTMTSSVINSAAAHSIGGFWLGYLDGYMTEVFFVDGQALAPSSFGAISVATGVWSPRPYTGTYGVNGFYLKFADASAATAAAIGKDSSGNANNWTPSGISVTAGVTYDSMIDVPTMYTDGGNGRGNYAILNPLKSFSANFNITQGNLQASNLNTTVATAIASVSVPTTGKWYFEVTATAVPSSLAAFIGITPESQAYAANAFNSVGSYRSNGSIFNLAGTAQTSGAIYTSGDVIGVAVDVAGGTCQFYKNNAAQGATPSFTFTAGDVVVPFVATDNVAGTKTFHANFGQSPFTYTPPAGFVALNTSNLPSVAITRPDSVMAATAYTGNGTSLTISNANNNVSFQPDFVWIKGRSAATDHALYDSVRGTTKDLVSNSTAAETAQATGLTAFNSAGFAIGALAKVNSNTATYVAWQWKENIAAGFDIAIGTAPASGAFTVSHSLGIAPAMIILKDRSAIGGWFVYHKAVATPQSNYLQLNATAAATGSATMWNNTAPTSASFQSQVLASVAPLSNYVAYCFAEIAGYSRFGSYTGNGAADGPFVYCGFRPRFVMLKVTSTTENWTVFDTSRDTFNFARYRIHPNLPDVESTGTEAAGNIAIDILSNGFKLRNTSANINASAATYIFSAFAESPFKYSLAR